MKKFLFIYNASNDDDGSDEAWMEWFTSIGKSVVDIGNPFDGGVLTQNEDDLSSMSIGKCGKESV